MPVFGHRTFLCVFASDLEKDGFSWEKDGCSISVFSSPVHAAEHFAYWHTEFDDDADANMWRIAVLDQDTGETTFWDVEADITYTAFPVEE